MDTVPSKDLAWWVPVIDHKITPEVRDVLEKYSNIPPSKVGDHVYAIVSFDPSASAESNRFQIILHATQRDKAWSTRPWPFTGMGAFLSPTPPKHPIYPTTLNIIQAGGKLIDIGCYCGTDLRRLASDGFHQANLYSTEFLNHWDVGYELDREKVSSDVRYIEADILNRKVELLDACAGMMDIISAIYLLHNWDWDAQVRATISITALSRLGTKVVGIQVGTRNTDPSKCISEATKDSFGLHNLVSFARMWNDVGRATGTVGKVHAEIRDWADFGYRTEDTKNLGVNSEMLQFVVTREQ